MFSFFNSIAYKDRTASSLAGTLSATHPATLLTVTNEAPWSPRSKLTVLIEKKEGRVSQARTREVVPEALSHLPPESLILFPHLQPAPLHQPTLFLFLEEGMLEATCDQCSGEGEGKNWVAQRVDSREEARERRKEAGSLWKKEQVGR